MGAAALTTLQTPAVPAKKQPDLATAGQRPA
jgi:hypothetical protein